MQILYRVRSNHSSFLTTLVRTKLMAKISQIWAENDENWPKTEEKRLEFGVFELRFADGDFLEVIDMDRDPVFGCSRNAAVFWGRGRGLFWYEPGAFLTL